MKHHFTTILRLAQVAGLSAAAALFVPTAAWGQANAVTDESTESADPRPQREEEADPGDATSETADAESRRNGRRQPEASSRQPGEERNTVPADRRGNLREDDARSDYGDERDSALDRELDRDTRVMDRDRGFQDRRRFEDRRTLDDRRGFDEAREIDDASRSVSRRRGLDRRDRAMDSRQSARENFRVEDLRGPDLGLWFDRRTRDGLVISNVASSGAIAQFGFREGDRLISVNGQRVASERDFLNYLFSDDVIYDRVPVVVLRDNRRRLIYVRPDVFVSQTAVVDPLDRFGIVLDDRNTDRIVVWRVLPRSPAYYAGIRAGDVLTALDGYRIDDAGDLVRLIQSAGAQNVAVEVSRNQQPRELYVDLAIAETATQPRTSLRATVQEPIDREGVFDDIRSVDPSVDRRLRPRPDVPPGTRIPGGEVGRERGPIAPTGAEGGTPTTPMRLGFPR